MTEICFHCGLSWNGKSRHSSRTLEALFQLSSMVICGLETIHIAQMAQVISRSVEIFSKTIIIVRYVVNFWTLPVTKVLVENTACFYQQRLLMFSVVFDPASFYAHSEYEFGIMKMFGGFSSAVYSAYNEIIGETKGIRKRVQLYELFHHLNHWSVAHIIFFFVAFTFILFLSTVKFLFAEIHCHNCHYMKCLFVVYRYFQLG